jgi:hypothetical protein
MVGRRERRTENKMKRLLLSATVIATLMAGAMPVPAHAQALVRVATETKYVTLAAGFDLDGEAADDNQIVTVVTLADSTTFTIAAQPDSCRLIDMTIVDADSSTTAGTVTFTGTDCFGYARVCQFDFAVAATRGSGVKTLPVTTGPPNSSCRLGAVTSIISSALTGEGGAGDTILVGYTSNSENTWTGYGKLDVGPSGEHVVNLLGSYSEGKRITTAGVTTTTIDSVATNGAFTNVVAGDLITIGLGDLVYELQVVSRASAEQIVVHKAVKIPTAGQTFTFKHKYVTTDPTDRIWIPTAVWKALAVNWSIDSNTDTGGVVALLECIDHLGIDAPEGKWVPVETVTTASTVAQAPTVDGLGPVNLALTPFSYCRVGHRFGTGDDGDTGVEDINISVALSK